MTDNIFFFKVLAELSDTEYFTFLFLFPLTGGVRPLVENSTIFFIFVETLPYTAIFFLLNFSQMQGISDNYFPCESGLHETWLYNSTNELYKMFKIKD